MERIWTKSFIQMTLGMLILFTGFYLLLPTMPLFIKEMGGNESQVGLAVGVFTLTAVVFRPIVGGLLDRYGRRPFMIWGLLFFILSMYLYDWVGTMAILLALRVLHGASWALSTTAVSTAITDIIPASRRGEGMGWFGMAMTVAMAIGPMLGIWVLENSSFHGLFLLATGLSAAALLLVFSTRIPFSPQTTDRKIVLFERSVLPVTAVLFFVAVAYGGITTFLPLFGDSIQVNSGTFFLVYAVSLTLARPVAGRLSDRFGEAYVILPALIVTALSLVVLSFSNGLIGVIVAAVLYGIGFGSAQPALQAANLTLAPPDKRGVASASFMTAFDLGIGLGSIILGWVAQYTGYKVVFIVCAVSVFVSAGVFMLFVNRRLSEKRTHTG
ncbi:MFS transporter [Paenibacillus sp. FSL H7-0331]|uniref:MFS transporter n=1 Tax=Paenibacillus sp. FSL H7-0331 TaxID=1920421 RepID=UPI00096E20DE|nr:MFS transporter [Paenibacillus sp. FSL H7-0331]OMF11367.1 MFS transporter [Paenibacillus sp. FSL H7-0331]